MPLWWIAPLVLAALPAFWCGVVVLIAQFGWGRLAARYRTEAEAGGRRLRFASGRVGFASYRSTLHVGIEPDGLHLSVPLLFRPGHPPLFIPWGEVTDVTTRRLFGFATVALRVGTPHAATVTLPGRVVDAIREAVPDVG